MAFKNLHKYTQRTILMELFLKHTGNRYRVISSKPYIKEGKEPGSILDLLILQDNAPDDFYGEGKEDMTLNSFRVFILNGRPDDLPQKGEDIKLVKFIEEKSFVIDYDMILRFEDFEIVEKSKGGQK